MLLSEFIRERTAELERSYPSHEAGNMIVLLCCGRLGTQSWTHVTEPGMVIPEDRLQGLEADFRRLKDGEPLQYVLGEAWFCGRGFKVDPRVLIPRPETELLVEEAEKFISSLQGASVLDLCTGSGCIAWTLALDSPAAEVTAVDISEGALALAASQFASGSPPRFVKADVLDPEADFGVGECDLLVSNPPYVMDSEKQSMRRNVLDFEPHLALFVPDEDPLLFYRAVAGHAARLLKRGGRGIVEINERLGERTAALFVSAGFRDVRILEDLAGRDRFVVWNR